MNVSTTLLFSLKQDIYALNKLIEDIPKRNKDQQVNSWLFPSKPYNFQTNIVYSKTIKKSSYENCLEVTLDRLYVLINLIISHIDNSVLEKRLEKNQLIIIPSRLTLGYCVNLLWARILKLMEKEYYFKTNKTTNVSANQECCDKESQTDIISLNKCDSCSSAMLCMKNLLNFFEETKDSNERLKIQYKLFDITQFGCMMKVTSSIENSLSVLFKQLHDKKMENVLLKLENEKYKTELVAKDGKIAFLKEEVNILREKLGNGKLKEGSRYKIEAFHTLSGNQEILTLRQENSKLKEENNIQQNEIKKLRCNKKDLNNRLESIKNENKIVKEQRKSLERNVDSSLHVFSQYVVQLNKRTAVHDTEYNVVKYITDEYEKSINCLNIKLTKLTKNLEKIDLKIKYRYGCMDDILQDFLKYEGFCVKIRKMFKEKLELIKESNEKSLESINITGNPIEDFAKQIEGNKNKIKELENENIKLQQLLARFKNKKNG